MLPGGTDHCPWYPGRASWTCECACERWRQDLAKAASRGVRRIILRSGIMAVRHLSAVADPSVRPFVTSDGMGGTVLSWEVVLGS